MIAVAFSCGLALGLVLGAALWSAALWISKKVLSDRMKRESAAYRQEAIMRQKQIEKAKADLRMQYGDQMTPEQERIMEQELGKLYTTFPNPGMRKDS